jgi:hypothetical protein
VDIKFNMKEIKFNSKLNGMILENKKQDNLKNEELNKDRIKYSI